MVIRSRGQQLGDFKPKCRIQMYYYRMYSVYPEKCDPVEKVQEKTLQGKM